MKSDRNTYPTTLIKFFWIALALLCLMVSTSPSHALWEGEITSFSADQVMISPAGKVLSTTKLYITPEAYRMDGMPIGSQEGVTRNLTFLGFKKQNKQYIYNHDKKLYFESQLDEDDMLQKLKSSENIDSERILGKEKVSGYKCVKKEVTKTMTMMGTTHTSTEILWQSDKFEFPLRIRQEDGQIMEFRNIDTDEPSKKLFRRPTGYKRVDNMMAVMGMDFAAMAREREVSDNENRKPAQNNINDVNMNEVMANMRQAMGENADPEQMAQLQQIMSQAMGQAGQVDMNEGAATGLWKIIPQRPGDKVGTEIKSPNVYNVIMGTNASLNQVFNFYAQKLKSKGWKDGGMYIQDGQGTLSMMKGEQMLTIAWADNPGMEGNYTLFYNLKLNSPGI